MGTVFVLLVGEVCFLVFFFEEGGFIGEISSHLNIVVKLRFNFDDISSEIWGGKIKFDFLVIGAVFFLRDMVIVGVPGKFTEEQGILVFLLSEVYLYIMMDDVCLICYSFYGIYVDGVYWGIILSILVKNENAVLVFYSMDGKVVMSNIVIGLVVNKFFLVNIQFFKVKFQIGMFVSGTLIDSS